MSITNHSKTPLFTLAMTAVLAAGCGGGGSAGATAVGGSHTSSVGTATFTYFGQPKPMITAGTGQVTVSGLAGAAFTTVSDQPTKSLSNTFLAFGRRAGLGAIYSVPFTGGQETLLAHGPQGTAYPTVTDAQNMILYADGFSITSMFPDGTYVKPRTYTPAPTDPINLAASPVGNTLALEPGGGSLTTAPLFGGAQTQIQSNDNYKGLAWNPTATTIAYTVANSTYNAVYTTPVAGGTTTNITPTGLQNYGVFTNPTWNADGVTLCASITPNGASTSSLVEFGAVTTSWATLTPSGYNDSAACFSPDGSKIAFYRSNAGGASPGIYIEDTSGTDAYLLLPDPPATGLTGPVTNISWSPFPATQKLIGTGANFFPQSADGFLVSQSGPQFGCAVAFVVTTPSSATITSSPSTTSAQPLIFTLSGDQVTNVGWTNNVDTFGTSQAPAAGTTSALVMIDSNTGSVDNLAFAAAKPAASKDAAGNVTYSSKFSAVYDGTGKKLSSATVSQIVVNPKTGKLVSFK